MTVALAVALVALVVVLHSSHSEFVEAEQTVKQLQQQARHRDAQLQAKDSELKQLRLKHKESSVAPQRTPATDNRKVLAMSISDRLEQEALQQLSEAGRPTEFNYYRGWRGQCRRVSGPVSAVQWAQIVAGGRPVVLASMVRADGIVLQ